MGATDTVMNDPSTRALVSLLFAVSAFVVPALLIFVLSRVAGWPALADRYPAPPERPRALRQLAELLYGVPIDYPSLAYEMGLTPRFVEDLLEAHAAGT